MLPEPPAGAARVTPSARTSRAVCRPVRASPTGCANDQGRAPYRSAMVGEGRDPFLRRLRGALSGALDVGRGRPAPEAPPRPTPALTVDDPPVPLIPANRQKSAGTP